MNARGGGHAEVEQARGGVGVQTSGSVQVGVSTHVTNLIQIHEQVWHYSQVCRQAKCCSCRYHRGQCPQGLGPRPRLQNTRRWVRRYPHRWKTLRTIHAKQSAKQLGTRGRKKKKREQPETLAALAREREHVHAIKVYMSTTTPCLIVSEL